MYMPIIVQEKENVKKRRKTGFEYVFAKKNPGAIEKILEKVLVSLRKMLYNAAV